MYKHKFLIFSFSSEEEKVQQAMKQYRNRIIWRRETGRKKRKKKIAGSILASKVCIQIENMIQRVLLTGKKSKVCKFWDVCQKCQLLILFYVNKVEPFIQYCLKIYE